MTEFNLGSEVLSATQARMEDHKKSCQLSKKLKESMGITVSTNFQYFGWVAVDDNTYDGPGSAIGSGKTELQAIEDLVQQLEEEDLSSTATRVNDAHRRNPPTQLEDV